MCANIRPRHVAAGIDSLAVFRANNSPRREFMPKKFDPAPEDKLAVDPKKAIEADLTFNELSKA
jgi:hypothetical protein